MIDEGYVNQQIRIRYRAVFILPITKQESAQSFSLDAKTWFIQIYDEIFMSWGASVTYQEPDQNRIFVGAGYQINKDFSALAGFNYQLLVKSNGAQQENNMGIGIFLVYNFDLTK